MRTLKHVLLIDPRPMVSDVIAYAAKCWDFSVTRAKSAKGFRLSLIPAPLDGIYVVTCGPMSAKDVARIARLARRCGGVPWMAWDSRTPSSPAQIREELRTLTMRKRGPKPFLALKEATR